MSKRIFDLALVIPGVILISPILGITALLVALLLGSPIVFRQIRPGYQGKPFHVYKFRTMREAYDDQGQLLPDEQRLTKLGRFLRSLSIDELPELFNILRGEMSLVGPRPLLMQYLDRYTPEQARRHNVLPGMTGWAQVNGRNAITWEDKFKHDVWYVDHWSLRLDIKILILTPLVVLRQEGISQPGSATADEFLGTEADGPDNKR
jgi:lipopolysaccharide/colanic/teichoic acid biosynthesis glycosyltransferase